MLARARVVWKRTGVGLLACAVAAAAGLGAAASQAAGAPGEGVVGVRLGGQAGEARIVIDLGKPASAKVVDSGGADRRVQLLFSGVEVDEALQGASRGLVKSYVLDKTAGGARLRVELAADASVKRRFLLPPADGVDHYRYVIDIAAANPATAAREISKTARAPAKPQALALKKVIVIDAGHGGKDPGARGAEAREKDITLAAARALKARLERGGKYKVVLTRGSDVYVPLETRVQIARRADADLFISLHADSGTNPSLRGASVYTLSDKASARAAKFVDKDDWFMRANVPGGDRGVSEILLDLTQRATKNRSAAFAEQLLEEVADHTTLIRRSHRDAGFVVLLAPDVPAVLLEMGFLTNAQDEKLLRDDGRRARFMNAVGDAIDSYFAEQTRLAAR